MNYSAITPYLLIMRLDKPIGFFLVLWPTLWGLWLASAGKPNSKIVLIFLLGTLLMRSAGCVINDIADRRFDGFVERTKKRPLATQAISVRSAVILFFCLMLCAFSLVLFLNAMTIFLAFIGAGLAIIYPYLKRVTHLPQMGLGVAFSWGVPMAFSAVNNTVSCQGWFLFFTAMLWPVMYDTLCAMVDRADDLNVGIKSTAILFGKADRWWIGVLQSIFLGFLCVVGYVFQLTIFYDVSLVIVIFLFIYQQILIKDRLPKNCFKAFLNNSWVGFVIFLGIVLSYVNFVG